jgi:hypothetical protein
MKEAVRQLYPPPRMDSRTTALCSSLLFHRV